MLKTSIYRIGYITRNFLRIYANLFYVQINASTVGMNSYGLFHSIKGIWLHSSTICNINVKKEKMYLTKIKKQNIIYVPRNPTRLKCIFFLCIVLVLRCGFTAQGYAYEGTTIFADKCTIFPFIKR